MKPVTPIEHELFDYPAVEIKSRYRQGGDPCEAPQRSYQRAPLAGRPKRKQNTENQNSATVTQLPLSPGQKLRQARERRGLSAYDMAKRLHLSEHYVKAIESDRYEALPGRTFTRGYIRIYARELWLPAADLVEAFDEMFSGVDEAEVPTSTSAIKRRMPWVDAHISWISGLIITVVLALAIAWWWNTDSVIGDFSGEDQVSIMGVDGELIVENFDATDEAELVTESDVVPHESDSALFGDVVATQGGERSEKQLVSTDSVKAPASIEVQTEAPDIAMAPKTASFNGLDRTLKEKTAPQGQSEVTELSQSSPSSTDESMPRIQDTLHFRFTGESWVRVSDANNKVIHVSLRQNGEVLTVEGVAPFQVLLGDARVVAIKFNERAVSVPESRSQSHVVRFTLDPESE